MFESRPQESSLVAADPDPGQLSAQITWLRELIVVMVGQDRATRRQSELLFEMLRSQRAAKLAQNRDRCDPAQENTSLAQPSRPLARC